MKFDIFWQEFKKNVCHNFIFRDKYEKKIKFFWSCIWEKIVENLNNIKFIFQFLEI